MRELTSFSNKLPTRQLQLSPYLRASENSSTILAEDQLGFTQTICREAQLLLKRFGRSN
jgi:hypothetical protein